MSEKQKPFKVLKSGKIQLALWWNDQYKSFSYTLQKNYKDKSGDWKNTAFFQEIDLADIAFLSNFIKLKSIEKKANKDNPPMYKENAKPHGGSTPEGFDEANRKDNDIPF